jgi:hypothetical protein
LIAQTWVLDTLVSVGRAEYLSGFYRGIASWIAKFRIWGVEWIRVSGTHELCRFDPVADSVTKSSTYFQTDRVHVHVHD